MKPIILYYTLTTADNLSLFLPLLLLTIYSHSNGLFPSKYADSVPLIPAGFKMNDFEKSGRRDKSHLYDPLHIPIINVFSIMRKAMLGQAFSPLSGHFYLPSLHIDQLIGF